MAATLEGMRVAAHEAFGRALRLADAEAPQRLGDFEAALWTSLLEVGRALVALFLLRRAGHPRAATYVHEGRRYTLAAERTSALGTRFGKVDFTRRTGRPAGGATGATDLPIDRELGLCGGFSVGVVMAVTRLCAQLAFAPARGTFCAFHEWAPSSRATLRMVDATGAKARPFLEAQPAPPQDGDVLVALVDGRGAPHITHLEYHRRCRPRRKTRGTTKRARRRERRRAEARPRRAKGEKSKNAKVAIVGVLYTLRRTPNGYEGPINKRLYATFDSHEALFIWLRREAIKRGYGVKRCLFIADGSDHIWRLQKKYLPEVEPCLDWYHAIEKVWEAGQCFHPEGSEGQRAWVAAQAKRLRAGDLRAVIGELAAALRRIPRKGPGNKKRRERLARTLNHFFVHRHRMHYEVFRADDLDIGSGAVEGAVRNLVAMRLDGPGMRWGRDRAERVLHLRCILLNGLWDDFATNVASSGLTLSPVPEPARPYEAKTRRAA